VIRIGCRYRPKPAPMSADAVFIQSLLMAPQPERRSFVAETIVMLVIGLAAFAAVCYPG